MRVKDICTYNITCRLYIYTYRHLHVEKLRVREGRKESECFLLH